MLVLTEQAREVIRNIVEESEVGANGGLRIFKTLDAHSHGDHVHFSLDEQDGDG